TASTIFAIFPRTKIWQAATALGLLVTMWPTLISAQSKSDVPNRFPAELDAYIAKAVEDWEIPGLSIAIVRNDSVIVVKGYGVREMGKPDKVDEHTVFDAASLTKSFTATAVAMLVDEGKLRWDDPSRWLRFHLGDGTWEGRRLVSEAAMQEMHSPQLIIPTTPAFRTARLVNFFAAYGLGFQVMDYRGHPMLWHTGGGDGQLAYMALLPREKLGVAILVNTWIAPVIHGTLAARVLDTYLDITPLRDGSAEGLQGRPAQQQRTRDARKAVRDSIVRGSTPPRPLSAYAGSYIDSLYGDLTMRIERGALVLRMGREAADLVHRRAHTFLVRWRDPVFDELFTTNGTFTAGTSGAVDAFTMRLNRDTIAVRRVAER
ncbi:MAG: serine hydrolase, partial [Gemmatimonadota bacterium]|nr:serine hydrolase [Gemmatimonadota bacterium]